jgi:hypothetical protein
MVDITVDCDGLPCCPNFGWRKRKANAKGQQGNDRDEAATSSHESDPPKSSVDDEKNPVPEWSGAKKRREKSGETDAEETPKAALRLEAGAAQR